MLTEGKNMIRSYLIGVTLFLFCVVPLSGMVPAPVPLPTATILDVIKNDICSGGMVFVPTLQTAFPVCVIALLKMLHHGGFSFSQLFEGELFALLFGSLQFTVMGSCLGEITGICLGCLGSGHQSLEWYNENDFVNSKNAFTVRNGLRYSLAAFYTFLGFKALQGMLARESEAFFYKHPALIVFK